jgi:hypothetical protein
LEQATQSRLALVEQAQLVVALARLGQILFLVLLLLPVVVTEQTATQETAARAAALAPPRLEVELQGKATMVLKVTTTAQVMLLAAVVVALVQLVEVPHQETLAMVGQVLRQPSPDQASPAQAAEQVVETVAARPKVERAERAVAAMVAGQMETQERPEQLTLAVAVVLVGINHLRITLAKLAVAA